MIQFKYRLHIVIAIYALMQSFAILASEDYDGSGELFAEPNLDYVSSATLYLQNANGYFHAPILNSSVTMDISGIVANIEFKQEFHNQSNDWVEGLYTFPLPDSAAVNALNVTIGERTIVGEISEKKQAIKKYNEAKASGKVAGLVNQIRPNLFTTRFANVAPGESISITLRYIQTVSFGSDRYSLRIPLTLTPRYSNNSVSDVVNISPPQVPIAATTGHTMDHSVSVSGHLVGDYSMEQIDSPSHALDKQAVNEKLQFSLDNEYVLDRDFILEWKPTASVQPAISVWREKVENVEYLLATIQPPTSKADIPDTARELILVVDTSGSMAGASIQAAKSALRSAMSGLSHHDKFNIIEFNSQHNTLFTSPQFASENNQLLAMAFINNLHADGGTEMMPALRDALGYQQSGLLRQVVFVTDGSVGYEESVITAVTRQLRGARLFTVGIGTAPNEWFMRKVAEAGRGSAEFITNPVDAEQVMGRLLYKLETPALTGISISVDDATTEVVPEVIPDLYADAPVIVAAKLGEQATELFVKGDWGGALWEARFSLADAPLVNTGLSTIWARRKIESLEDLQRFNTDPDYYKSAILSVALEHKLLSRYTSFVAVEQTVSRPSESQLNSKTVPNLMPHGNQMESVPFPSGSTGTDSLYLVSFIFALLALGSIVFRSRPHQVIVPR